MTKTNSSKMFILMILFMVFSCVTINIYFPAEKVEKVANEITKEVREHQGKTTPAPEPKKEKEGSLFNFRFVNIIFPTDAYAQSATEVSNAVIREIKNRMKERFKKLIPYFKAGNIGEDNSGYLALRNVSGLNVKERARLNKLVKAENKDRKTLYAEVARALNISPDQVSRVAKIFARNWHETCEKGWWIQMDDGTWEKK